MIWWTVLRDFMSSNRGLSHLGISWRFVSEPVDSGLITPLKLGDMVVNFTIFCRWFCHCYYVRGYVKRGDNIVGFWWWWCCFFKTLVISIWVVDTIETIAESLGATLITSHSPILAYLYFLNTWALPRQTGLVYSSLMIAF